MHAEWIDENITRISYPLPTSIHNNKRTDDDDINVYPMPFADEIIFQVKNPDIEITEVEIFDISGKLIFRKKAIETFYGKKITGLNDLESGMYLYC